ncbi:hypothetical protein J6590_064287 [Homalodisca vitripennis]|nr:hypothetical protein J6590_064287 [Homalodisca vitripennis]
MDRFHTSGIQQESMESDATSFYYEEYQNWERVDEMQYDFSPLVREIQNVSIDEDLKMDWKRIDEIHDDSSRLVQGIQNVSIVEDLKMDWETIFALLKISKWIGLKLATYITNLHCNNIFHHDHNLGHESCDTRGVCGNADRTETWTRVDHWYYPLPRLVVTTEKSGAECQIL